MHRTYFSHFGMLLYMLTMRMAILFFVPPKKKEISYFSLLFSEEKLLLHLLESFEFLLNFFN